MSFSRTETSSLTKPTCSSKRSYISWRRSLSTSPTRWTGRSSSTCTGTTPTYAISKTRCSKIPILWMQTSLRTTGIRTLRLRLFNTLIARWTLTLKTFASTFPRSTIWRCFQHRIKWIKNSESPPTWVQTSRTFCWNSSPRTTLNRSFRPPRLAIHSVRRLAVSPRLV